MRGFLAALSAALFTAYVAALAVLATDPNPGSKVSALTPFLVLAGVAGLLAFLADFRPIVARVAFLRPGSYEISRVLRAGNDLQLALAEIRPQENAADVALEPEWTQRVEVWYNDARKVVEKHAPDFLSHFESDADFKSSIFRGVPEWVGNLRSFMSRRLSRLSDVLLRV